MIYYVSKLKRQPDVRAIMQHNKQKIKKPLNY